MIPKRSGSIMKHGVLILVCLLGFFMPSKNGFCQGDIFFSNRVTPFLDAPVFYADCITRLEGPRFVAQLYAGPKGTSPFDLAPVGRPLDFRSGPLAGYLIGGTIRITFVFPGQEVTVQMRAWEAAAGSFETAQATGALHAVSPPLDVRTSILFDPASELIGLQSFCLVPEPDTIFLVLLGGVAWLARLWRTRRG